MAKFDNKMNASLNRMKSLMTYGMQNESKQYNSVENYRKAADGKTYAIIREGSKYYIKYAETNKDPKTLVAENFDYVGGFRNRKDYQYNSFADAQKNFDFKMRSIQEAYDKNAGIIIESWNPDRKEELTVEATEKLRKEILREREIMRNVGMLNEADKANVQGKQTKVKGEEGATQKNNIKKQKPETGDAKKAESDFWTPIQNVKDNTLCLDGKSCKNTVKESAEVLGWNDSKDYMDKSHGTEIGDSAPFDVTNKKETGEMENGVVEEGEVMHTAQNQNTPTPGTNEIGDDDPFTKKVNEDVDLGGEPTLSEDDDLEMGDEEMPADAGAEGEEPMGDEEGMEDSMGGEMPMDGEEPMGEEMPGDETEFELETGDEEEDPYNEETVDELGEIKDLLSQILTKLGGEDNVDASEYDDEPLYDDDEDMYGDDEDVEVYESRAYKQLMKEEHRLDDFGKHPAYQKKVMTYPTFQHQEKEGYYDMNDDSVRSEAPYGQQIGDGAPFEVDPEEIANSIAESINRMLKKKSK